MLFLIRLKIGLLTFIIIQIIVFSTILNLIFFCQDLFVNRAKHKKGNPLFYKIKFKSCWIGGKLHD